MCPELKESIELIIKFWHDFKDKELRTLYNFIKHRGKPLYEESQKHSVKLMSLYMGKEKYPTDRTDIQKIVNLRDKINELKEFDDKELFPYIEKLFKSLESAIQPSELVRNM